MCDFGLASLALSTAGGLASARSNATMSRSNAAMSRYEAGQTAEIGRFNELQAKSRMDRLIAAQRSQLIARGQSLASTSAQDAGDAAAKERFMEMQAQRFNTEGQVRAKSNEAAIYDYQASSGLMAGTVSTVARGFGQALDLWPQLMGT